MIDDLCNAIPEFVNQNVVCTGDDIVFIPGSEINVNYDLVITIPNDVGITQVCVGMRGSWSRAHRFVSTCLSRRHELTG